MRIEDLKPVIEQKLSHMGLELFDIRFIRAGSRPILRIYVDRPEGVSIKDCEQVSQEISMLLDVENFSSRAYTLEVSSPGIDRPLTTEKDFARVKGKPVRLQIREGEGVKAVKGMVEGCADGVLVLLTDDGSKEFTLDQVHSGKVEVSFT